MRHLVLVGVLVMGLGLVATPAQAQDNTFVGVSEVSIFVEDLGDGEAKCNVTKGGLDAAVRLPLDASRLRIDPDASPYVYVVVTVTDGSRFLLPAPSGGGCVGSLSVGLRRTLAIPGTTQLVFGASVWEKGYSLTGPSSGFGQRVNQQVTDFTKELIAEWIKANPRQ